MATKIHAWPFARLPGSSIISEKLNEKSSPVVRETKSPDINNEVIEIAPKRKEPQDCILLYDWFSHWYPKTLEPCATGCNACDYIFRKPVSQGWEFFLLSDIPFGATCSGARIIMDIYNGLCLHIEWYRVISLRFRLNERQNVEVNGFDGAIQSYSKPILGYWYEILDLPNAGHRSQCSWDQGRLIDSNKLDTDLMRDWLHDCDTRHGEACRKVEIEISLSSLLLVDVVDGCLVKASSKIRYVALSYVWGTAQNWQTTRLNLFELLVPGSLQRLKASAGLPDTICDAMQLTRELGQRYLWVDTLSIVQDDLPAKSLYLDSMASIYANAYVTLVAAEGKHANHGISGVPNGSRRRCITRYTIESLLGEGALLSPVRRKWPEHSPWNRRGWTFQELLFSKRVIILDGVATWHCPLRHSEEDKIRSNHRTSSTSPSNDIFLGRSPLCNASIAPLETWGKLVQRFNRRELSYDEDVYSAFSGITSMMERWISCGFHYGLPADRFLDGLMWLPAGPLRRRAPSYRNHVDVPPFPSWSWMGWQGDVNCSLWTDDSKLVDGVRFVPKAFPHSPKVCVERGFPNMDIEFGQIILKTTTISFAIGDTFVQRSCLASFRIKDPATGADGGFMIPHISPNESFKFYSGSCTLIAIQTGYLRNSFLDPHLCISTRDPRNYTAVYMVLWIGKEDGIIYRKGIGAVLKHVWEEQRLTEGHIALG